VSGKSLSAAIVAASFDQITFTNDPIASSLITDASHATAVGLLKPVSNLSAIYDLGPLNKLLTAAGQPQVGS
jgi:NitT/TauT family transport system substrate-binding protein